MEDGKLGYITQACLFGYKLNGGDLAGMTPLQKMAMVTINQVIMKWKVKNKPLLTI